MTDEPLSVRFCAAFANALGNADLGLLRAAWLTPGARTAFYADLFRQVGAELTLDLEQELLIVDFALIGRSDRVPRVFIESENVASFAVQEVRKLCCLSAPLKVLLTVAEWDNSPSVWPKGAVREQLLPVWCEEVSRHRAAGTLVGEVIVVVAEWRPENILHCYTRSLESSTTADEIFVRRSVGDSTLRDPVV